MRLRLPRDEMVDQVHDLRGDHQSRATMNRRIFHGAACLWIVCSSGTASGHEPLFMMSHEAPGKGASDVHLAIHGERTPARDETEFELEYTRGLTRNLAVKVGIPLVREEERIADVFKGDTGVGDPSVRIKWRFWDRDVLGAKYAVALMVHSTIPVGEGPARRGHERPSILWGLSHGRESLAWYYFVDMRYRYRWLTAVRSPGTGCFSTSRRVGVPTWEVSRILTSSCSWSSTTSMPLRIGLTESRSPNPGDPSFLWPRKFSCRPTTA